jgi:DNA-binding GntR family transcriptional regulator
MRTIQCAHRGRNKMPKAVDILENKTARETGSTRVYSALRKEILRVRLAPGAPLDEVGLSERFNMSRSPIREALVRLSSDGLVVMLPNRSTIVAPMDFHRIPEYLDALDLLQRVVTRLAAEQRTPTHLKAIVKAQKNFERAIGESVATKDSLPVIEANFEFHMAIAEAGRNLYFKDLYRRLLDEGKRMLHFHFQFEVIDSNVSAEKFTSDHTEIVDAIAAMNGEKAERFAHNHAIQFKGRFLQFLDRNLTASFELSYRLSSDKMSSPQAVAGERTAKQRRVNRR